VRLEQALTGALLLAALSAACSTALGRRNSEPPAGAARPERVRELRVGFSVGAPFTSADAIGMADAMRPMIRSDEEVDRVDAVACRKITCGGGIDARAEAVVMTSSSDVSDIIELCRRAGRWFASRPTDDAFRTGCPYAGVPPATRVLMERLADEIARVRAPAGAAIRAPADWRSWDLTRLVGIDRATLVAAFGPPFDACPAADGIRCTFGAALVYDVYRLGLGELGGGPHVVLDFDQHGICSRARWLLTK